MENPFLDDEGFRVEITRIEFEPIEGGIIRWSAWNGDRLLLKTTAHADRPAEMRKILETTRILATAAAEPRSA